MDILGKPAGIKPASEFKSGSVMDVLGTAHAIQPASELKTGSVMDILKKSANAGTNANTHLTVAIYLELFNAIDSP